MTIENLPAAEPVGAIEGDLSCRKCSYNLRGLDAQGRCPECGTAVGYSVRGDLLRFSDPDWLRGLRQGAVMIVSASVLLVLMSIGMSIFLPGVRVAANVSTAFVLRMVSLGILAVFYAGVWKLTASDPSGLGEDHYGGVRRFIRIAILAAGLARIVDFFLTGPTVPTELVIGWQLLSVVVGLVGIAGFCCQLVYLSRLARRLPDAKLAARGVPLAWMNGLSLGMILLLRWIPTMVQALRLRANVITPVSCASAIAAVVFLVAGLGYLLMLDRFRRRLREEESIARQTWAA